MKEVNVTVSGKACTGKSTVAHLLQHILEQAGFEVELNDIDPLTPAAISRRLDHAADRGFRDQGFKAVINVVQLKR